MKTKFRRILFAALILTLVLAVFAACNTAEQSLEGLVIVTFDFNGGNLNNSATIVYDLIKHGYEPNSFVINIASYQNYKLTKAGYVFDGWYTKNGIENDDWGKEWNFKTDRVTEDITLYAKWKLEIVYSYTMYYVDEKGVEHDFLTYEVEAGDKFAAPSNFTSELNKKDRTYRKVDDIGFYSDKDWTPWDDNYTHEGGEVSKDVAVYVKSIPGVWTFVSNYDELKSAMGKNIWLTQDIDCGGQELYFGDYNNTLYGGGFEEDGLADDEGYSISNFKVPNSFSNTSMLYFSIFGELGVNAKLQNVNFTDVHFEIISSSDTWNIEVSALARSADVTAMKNEDGSTTYKTCVIENVTVQGTYSVDLSERDLEFTEEELLKAISDYIEQPFREANDKVDTSTLTVDIKKKD